MAYEKLSEKKTIATNLGTFISSQLTLLSQNRVRKNLEDEQRFNKAVMEDNLSLEQQLDYRKEQLKKVETGDKDERLRIKKEISSLTDRIEQQKFNDDYLEQLTKLNSGAQSISTTISWLNDTLSRSTDTTIRSNIRDNINQLEGKLYDTRKNALDSATTYASNSQDQTIIERQITNVNNARSLALNSGNDDYVALLDLQLQTLSKAKSEAAINKTLMDYSVATMVGGSATSLLNEFNRQLEGADSNTPVTIGGTRYDSSKQFWEMKRSEYLNDRSENGFFGRYKSELDDQVTYKSSKNILNNDTFKDVSSWYDTLKDRPELQGYATQIDQDKQKSLTSTADLRSNHILNTFAIDLDAKKALSDLAYIQDTYGVNQTLNYQKIVTSAAKEKQDQVSQILSTMSTLMSKNPSLTSQQAMEAAVKMGAGATVSPEELATNKASDIVKNLSTSAENNNFNETSPLTVDKGYQGKFSSASLKEGGLYKSPNDKTVYKYENGNLRPFAGNWSEDQFKQYTGQGYNAVQSINSLADISKGEPITNQLATNNQPTPELGEKIANPDLLKYYNPTDIVTQGSDKYLKSGVKSVIGKKLGPTEFGQLQKQYDPATLEKKIVRSGSDIYLRA